MGDEYCFAVGAVGCYVAVDVWEVVFGVADHFGGAFGWMWIGGNVGVGVGVGVEGCVGWVGMGWSVVSLWHHCVRVSPCYVAVAMR